MGGSGGGGGGGELVGEGGGLGGWYGGVEGCLWVWQGRQNSVLCEGLSSVWDRSGGYGKGGFFFDYLHRAVVRGNHYVVSYLTCTCRKDFAVSTVL